MKELSDQRNYYVESLGNIKTKITGFRDHLDSVGKTRLNLQQINIDGDGYQRKEDKSPSPAKRKRRTDD